MNDEIGLVPYIGITDFMTFEEVNRMVKVFLTHLPEESRYKLHVGVMMSYKTLHGFETKWSKAFPPKEMISSIFSSSSTFNCLHYADYGYDATFYRSLALAIFYGGIGIDGVQLDMIWPKAEYIAEGLHTSRRNIEVILQIGKKAIEEADNNPEEVVYRLEEYQGIIHGVLLDMSVGKGVAMDAEKLMSFAYAIKDKFPDLELVVAGGLGPDTIELVSPLANQFGGLSIDAQSRLRPSNNALDPIDWDMAEKYLIEALKLLE